MAQLSPGANPCIPQQNPRSKTGTDSGPGTAARVGAAQACKGGLPTPCPRALAAVGQVQLPQSQRECYPYLPGVPMLAGDAHTPRVLAEGGGRTHTSGPDQLCPQVGAGPHGLSILPPSPVPFGPLLLWVPMSHSREPQTSFRQGTEPALTPRAPDGAPAL